MNTWREYHTRHHLFKAAFERESYQRKHIEYILLHEKVSKLYLITPNKKDWHLPFLLGRKQFLHIFMQIKNKILTAHGGYSWAWRREVVRGAVWASSWEVVPGFEWRGWPHHRWPESWSHSHIRVWWGSHLPGQWQYALRTLKFKLLGEQALCFNTSLRWLNQGHLRLCSHSPQPPGSLRCGPDTMSLLRNRRENAGLSAEFQFLLGQLLFCFFLILKDLDEKRTHSWQSNAISSTLSKLEGSD